MGLQIVALCALRGLYVIASDPLADRRAWAHRFGAIHAVNPFDGQLPEQVHECTAGHGIDLAIVACPSPQAFTDALASLAPGGTLVLFSSMPSEPVPISLEHVHRQRISIVGSRWVIGRKHPHYELYWQAAQLLESGAIAPGVMVDTRVSLDGVENAFRSLQRHDTLKTICIPGLAREDQ